MKMRRIAVKKGLSPIIATILLVAIVIILAVIIFLWARGFVAERAQKFGRAVELSCEEVNFDTGVFNDLPCQNMSQGNYALEVVNRGNIPIYGFEVKELTSAGTISLLKEILGDTIGVGRTAKICLENVQVNDNLLVVPIILGTSGESNVAFTCPDQFGFSTTVVDI